MASFRFRTWVLGSALIAIASSGLGAPSSAPSSSPASRKAPTQIYQGELGGKLVWLELIRTPRGVAGKLGDSLHGESSKVTFELTPSDNDFPPTFIPQGFAASDCRLTIADNHSEVLQSTCLSSMQGPDLVEEGFPELILGADPRAKGKQFWLRAVDQKVADSLASFAPLLQQAKPPPPNACIRTVRIDQALRAHERTIVGYWTWDLCSAALLTAAKVGKADPGKPVWRETAWLGIVSTDATRVTRVALGQRQFANETLELVDLGRLDALNLIRVERDAQDAFPTGFTRQSETRVYAASDRGTLTLALGPFSNTESSGNCVGADLNNQLFSMAPGSPPNSLIVRSSKTERRSRADSCESTVHASYRGYRFNPKTNKFDSYQRPDLEALVKAQLPP